MKYEGSVDEVIEENSKALWWWRECNIRHFCYDLFYTLAIHDAVMVILLV